LIALLCKSVTVSNALFFLQKNCILEGSVIDKTVPKCKQSAQLIFYLRKKRRLDCSVSKKRLILSGDIANHITFMNGEEKTERFLN